MRINFNKLSRWRSGLWMAVLLVIAPGVEGRVLEAFTAALDRGDLEQARDIVRYYPRVDSARERNSMRTFLMMAARHEAAPADLLEAIMERDGKVNRRDRNRWSALDHAAWSGSLDKVKVLVAAGATLQNAENVARENGFFEIEAFLQSDRVREREGIQASLHGAAATGDLDGVRGLIMAGARIDLPHANGESVLLGAFRGGNPEVVAYLLELAERERFEFSHSPLTPAVTQGAVEAVRQALNRGVSPDSHVAGGIASMRPPLIEAVFWDHEEIVALLLEFEADPDIRWRGATALAWAENQYRAGIADRLRSAGAVAEGNTGSPLIHAQTPERVAEILAAGADPNAINDIGQTALITAFNRCLPNIARLLIEGGADVNLAPPAPEGHNVRMSPPLVHAVLSCGSPSETREVIRLMLQRGADPNARHHNGRTVLELATELRKTELVELLLNHGANPGS